MFLIELTMVILKNLYILFLKIEWDNNVLIKNTLLNLFKSPSMKQCIKLEFNVVAIKEGACYVFSCQLFKFIFFSWMMN